MSKAIILFKKSIFCLLIFIFFYNLADAPLLSYDEAWYAEITRNMILTKNPLKLIFNGRVFTDHPPLGYILMSIPTMFFGSNEFSTRFISSLLGLGSIILVYLVGKKLNNKTTGIIAALVLLSSMWFMFRARSGNLDIPFIFFEILTVYFFLEKGKQNFLYGAISFTCLFLIKTLVGVGVLPVILFLLYTNHRKYNFKTYLQVLVLSITIALPWYVYNTFLSNTFLHHHFITIGTRGEMNTFSFDSIFNALSYLAIGIGKWYKIFLVSVVISLITFIVNKKQQKKIVILFLWFAGFSVFFISSKTEIWHLLPVYPVIAVCIGLLPTYLTNFLPAPIKPLKYLLIIFFIILAGYQFNQFSNLIYTNLNGYSDEKDISIKAGKYDNINLMETFYPASVYYSQSDIIALNLTEFAYESMVNQLRSKANSVFIINNSRKQELEKDAIPFYILDKNSSYFIITNKLLIDAALKQKNNTL